MPELGEPPFWDSHALYAASLAQTLWPGSVGRFVIETQRYQGLSDRLQTEVFRRHDPLGGYCLTELTDVPLELNGLLDLERRPKPIAVAETRRANQTVLPMLLLESLVVEAGEELVPSVHVANDGPPLEDVTFDVRFGSSSASIACGSLAARRAVAVGTARVTAPAAAGSHDLVVSLRAGSRSIAENRYPMHVVRTMPARVG